MRVDDFLGLSATPLHGVRCVVFAGASGSGKSTMMKHLLSDHPDFKGQEVAWIKGPPLVWSAPSTSLIAVDEILGFGDLCRALMLARRGTQLVMAVHAPWLVLLMLRALGVRVFRTDKTVEKLGRHLDALGYRWSRPTLERYARLYGATYTDLGLILERCNDQDFDRAFARFHRRHHIVRLPA